MQTEMLFMTFTGVIGIIMNERACAIPLRLISHLLLVKTDNYRSDGGAAQIVNQDMDVYRARSGSFGPFSTGKPETRMIVHFKAIK